MSESQAIGIRLGNAFLNSIASLSREEHLDRSTAIRLLLEEGYRNYIKRKAAEAYVAGKITISRAAEKANMSIWEMAQYLVAQGFKSQYSIDDLKEEMNLMRRRK